MRSVKKSTVDELVRVVKKYQKTGDGDLLAKRHELTVLLSKQAFAHDCAWIDFSDLVFGCVALRKDVLNRTIYAVLGLLGIAVMEE